LRILHTEETHFPQERVESMLLIKLSHKKTSKKKKQIIRNQRNTKREKSLNEENDKKLTLKVFKTSRKHVNSSILLTEYFGFFFSELLGKEDKHRTFSALV
jgi:hypothetical protein